MKERSGATRLKSNEVQNNICRSQSIKYFSDRLLAEAYSLASISTGSDSEITRGISARISS